MRDGAIGSRPDFGWALVDPNLSTVDACVAPQTILDLAGSGWATEVQLDVENQATERFLTVHRVSTLLRPVDVLPAQQDAFRQRLMHITGVQLRIEAVADQVLRLYAEHSIDSRVLKGLASAELDYPDRAFRQTGDVDLAVPRERFDDAVRALLDNGFEHLDKPHPKALLKGTTLRSPSGVEVDLHTRLFQRSPFTDELFAAPEPLRDLCGSALSPPMRMVHAAGHFILAPPGTRRMSGLVDITMLRRRPDMDLEEVRRIAAVLGVEGLVRAALTLEATLSGTDHIRDRLDSWNRTSWLDRKTRLGNERNLVLDHLARFREVPVGERLSYLPDWLVPDRRRRKIFVRSLRTRVAHRKRR